MKKLLPLTLSASLMVGCRLTSHVNSQKQPVSETQLYYHGKIITMETNDIVYAEAVVAQNGKIAFVGPLNEAKKLFPTNTKIDLNGKTL